MPKKVTNKELATHYDEMEQRLSHHERNPVIETDPRKPIEGLHYEPKRQTKLIEVDAVTGAFIREVTKFEETSW